jgi:hypothetical protein
VSRPARGFLKLRYSMRGIGALLSVNYSQRNNLAAATPNTSA